MDTLIKASMKNLCYEVERETNSVANMTLTSGKIYEGSSIVLQCKNK